MSPYERSDVSRYNPNRPVPDGLMIDKELRKRGVTRMLLWQEYREQHPGGFDGEVPWSANLSFRLPFQPKKGFDA